MPGRGQDLENYHRLPGQQVMWLLVSDSLSLRRLAKAKYGDKLVVHDGDAEVRTCTPASLPDFLCKPHESSPATTWLSTS